jgi:hypothetical protein
LDRKPQRQMFLRRRRALLVKTPAHGQVSEYHQRHDAIPAHLAEEIGVDQRMSRTRRARRRC